MKNNRLFGIVIFLVAIFFNTVMPAQTSKEKLDSIRKLSQQDHQLMLERLGIEDLRPGPSGNPEDKNAANSDESLVHDFDLPDPLIFDNGDKVINEEDWEKRRLEILEYFNREVYGRLPENIPDVSWNIISEKDTVLGKYPVVIRSLEGIVDNSFYPEIEVKIDLTVTLPKNVKNKVPMILKFDWIWPGMENTNKVEPWQELLLEENWGYASLIPTSYQADHGAGLRSGIIGLVNRGEPRKIDDWGALRAWAWGASRVLDYFEQTSEVDESRVAIEGLSRYGKAAMVAMAYDERFAIGFIGSAGAGGTKILRRNFGEQVENLASSYEYHWFTPNFIKYAGPLTVNDLETDAHELIALAAPRPVFISTGDPKVEGNWVDAKGMFLGGLYASPVYEIFGEKGIENNEYPGVGPFLNNGNIAFRAHEGGHTVGPNWEYFIEYAKKFF